MKFLKALVLATFLFATSASAFNVTPQILFFDSNQVSKKILVIGDKEKPRPVEVKIYKTSFDIDGKESLEDSAFPVVWPPQFILQPQQNRQIRITFPLEEKKKKLAIERVYRVSVTGVSLELDQIEQRGLKFNLQFLLWAFERPENIIFEAELSSVAIDEDTFSITLNNTGNVHLRPLQGCIIKLYKDGTLVHTINDDNILPTTSRILAKAQRKLTYKIDDLKEFDNIEVKLVIEKHPPILLSKKIVIE